MELDDTFSKRACLSGVGGRSSAGGPDLLSSLPDCLLHTIMSFLKARQAVQTCVLSTRWRHLWRSVPCLDIDFDEFKTVHNNSGSGGDHNSGSGGDDNSDSCDDSSSSSDSDTSEYDSDMSNPDYFNRHFTERKDWEDFEDFAVTLMRRCNIAQLDSFRLRIVRSKAPKFGNRLAAGWLCRALKYCTPGRAIQQGLNSGSWHLKRLHLCHVLVDDDSLNRVSSVCLSLEDLKLDDGTCEIESITSNSLKTLVLKNCRWRNISEIITPILKTLVIDAGGYNTEACELVISAPALTYLHLAVDVNKFRGGVSLNEVPTVAKALIRLRSHKYSYAGSKLGGDQFKLLCSLSSSTNLELSGVGTKVLGKEPRFQEFKNLRNLLLNNCNLSHDFRTLVFFLRSSPILEKLTLRCCKFPKCSEEEHLPIRNKISSSELHGLDLLCENLKVEIIYKDGYGPYLMQLLLQISVNLSKNNIKLTKVN